MIDSIDIISKKGDTIGFSFYIVLLSLICVILLALLICIVNKKSIVGFFLTLWVLVVLIVTLFARKDRQDIVVYFNPVRKYVELWRSVIPAMRESGMRGLWNEFDRKEFLITELLLNILLFVPMGYLVPLFREAYGKLLKMIVVGFSFSLFIELTQFFTHLGCFDVSDLLHNTIGVGIGYLIYHRWLRNNSRVTYTDKQGGQV